MFHRRQHALRSLLPIALGVLFSLLTACQQATTRMPMVEHYEASYQKEVLRAEHWREMAQTLAAEVSTRSAGHTLTVEHPREQGNRFHDIYPSLVETALSAEGVRMDASRSFVLEIETYYLAYNDHATGGLRERGEQMTAGAIAGSMLGVLIGHAGRDWAAGASIGGGAGALAGLIAYDTNHTTFWSGAGHTIKHSWTGAELGGRPYELVVSSTLRSRDGEILGKFAQIVYVNGADLHLYARSPHRTLSLVDES